MDYRKWQRRIMPPYTLSVVYKLQWRESLISNFSVRSSKMTLPGPGKWTRRLILPKSSYTMRRLKKFGMSAKTLTNFYRCTIESVLSGCITAWHGSCSAADCNALQRVVKTAERITRDALGNHKTSLPPRLWTVQTAAVWQTLLTHQLTVYQTHSFFPQAVKLLNQQH